MSEWHTIKDLPKFRNNETDYVEIMFSDGTKDTACFKKCEDGTVYCDTGYCNIDMELITKWRYIDLF